MPYQGCPGASQPTTSTVWRVPLPPKPASPFDERCSTIWLVALITGNLPVRPRDKSVTNFRCRRVGGADCFSMGPELCVTKGPGHVLRARILEGAKRWIDRPSNLWLKVLRHHIYHCGLRWWGVCFPARLSWRSLLPFLSEGSNGVICGRAWRRLAANDGQIRFPPSSILTFCEKSKLLERKFRLLFDIVATNHDPGAVDNHYATSSGRPSHPPSRPFSWPGQAFLDLFCRGCPMWVRFFGGRRCRDCSGR